MTESHLLRAIRVALGREADLTLWRNQVGVATYKNRSGEQTVPYGLCKGASDLVGILAPHGRLVALEVKSPTGRESDEQIRFVCLVRRRGGFAAFVRSVDEALAAVHRARQGLCE